jgi:undecaprenyl diphosphate synthase
MARLDPHKLPHHIAIIPDGNGRWAEARGLSREEGHRRGTDAVRDAVRAVHELRIPMLTLYAFSTENWERPKAEVDWLMQLLHGYLREQADELVEQGIRVEVIGRPHELDATIQREIDSLLRRTESNDEMRLAFGLSYSGRGELVDAARAIARTVERGELDPEGIDEKTIRDHLYLPHWPDPDLLIRFGGESRVSNFLLWELAYTELYFSPMLWPDFTKAELVEALVTFQARERRHGKTGAQVRRGP